MERKIFLENLPKTLRNEINWRESVGQIVHATYGDIEVYIKIVSYISGKHPMLSIEYNSKRKNISTSDFKNCKIGSILGIKTSDFKYEIGQIIKDNKRNITIINREYRQDKNECKRKWYQYKCNKCKYKGWMIEGNLNSKQGCSTCAGVSLVEGINDIPTIAPWMVKYFQGGYDEAKLYTYSSAKKIKPICPDCGRVRNKAISIYSIYGTHSIGCSCSDNFSYGEKFIFSILEQLKVNFQTQLSKTTFDWCKNYKYDFYFEWNNEQYILEVNGLQHYEEKFTSLGGRTLKEEIENDR